MTSRPTSRNGEPVRELPAIGRWTFAGHLSEGAAWPCLLLLPALLLVASVILYPTLHGLLLGFREWRLLRPDLGTGFVGLRHFRELLGDAVFWQALRNTLVWLASTTTIEFALGLATAVALERRLPGSRWFAAAICLPYFLPSVVVGHLWALLLDFSDGPVNSVLVGVGLLSAPSAWFADPRTAFECAVLAEVWHGFPFFTLILLAAFRAVPREQLEAAAVDGAGALVCLYRVTLPLLRVVIAAAVLLRAIGLVAAPDLIFILTGGGPGRSTQTLSLYAFETAYRGFDFGYASALSTMTGLILVVLAAAYVRLAGFDHGWRA